MRFPGQIRIWSGGHEGTLRSEPAREVGSQEDDRSLAAVMREIAWSLAGWLSVVVTVQLLLHAFHVV